MASPSTTTTKARLHDPSAAVCETHSRTRTSGGSGAVLMHQACNAARCTGSVCPSCSS